MNVCICYIVETNNRNKTYYYNSPVVPRIGEEVEILNTCIRQVRKVIYRHDRGVLVQVDVYLENF